MSGFRLSAVVTPVARAAVVRITSSGALSPHDPVSPPVSPKKPAPHIWNGHVERTKAAADLERSRLARLSLQRSDAREDYRVLVRKLGHEREPPA